MCVCMFVCVCEGKGEGRKTGRVFMHEGLREQRTRECLWSDGVLLFKGSFYNYMDQIIQGKDFRSNV